MALPQPDQFVSNVFLRPKSNGQFRLILDLRIDTSGGGVNFGALFQQIWISYFLRL